MSNKKWWASFFSFTSFVPCSRRWDAILLLQIRINVIYPKSLPRTFFPTRTALWTRHLHVCFKNITHLTVKSRINCYLSFLYLQSSFSTNSYYFPFALLIRYKHFNYNTLHYNICIFKPRVNTYPLKNPPLSNHTLYTLSNLYKQ